MQNSGGDPQTPRCCTLLGVTLKESTRPYLREMGNSDRAEDERSTNGGQFTFKFEPEGVYVYGGR